MAVEAGRLGLDDAAHEWVDPVLRRMWNSSLEALWGKNSTIVTIRDLLGMTSGFADYDDAHLEALTLRYAGDDVGPFVYLTSAARQGWLHQGYVSTCVATQDCSVSPGLCSFLASNSDFWELNSLQIHCPLS